MSGVALLSGHEVGGVATVQLSVGLGCRQCQKGPGLSTVYLCLIAMLSTDTEWSQGTEKLLQKQIKTQFVRSIDQKKNCNLHTI